MLIEVKGIIRQAEKEGTAVYVVVKEGQSGAYKRHRFGDVSEVTRGKIINFLSALYDVGPGDIVWPAHIEV